MQITPQATSSHFLPSAGDTQSLTTNILHMPVECQALCRAQNMGGWVSHPPIQSCSDPGVFARGSGREAAGAPRRAPLTSFKEWGKEQAWTLLILSMWCPSVWALTPTPHQRRI